MFIPVPVACPGLAFLRLVGKIVRREGAANDRRGGCAPQNEDGSLMPIIGWCRSSTVTLAKNSLSLHPSIELRFGSSLIYEKTFSSPVRILSAHRQFILANRQSAG